MRSISTLLKRISSIERVIDIVDCLTVFTLSQFASMHVPFFSRPLSVSVLITFYRPLFVCFLYIHPTVASGRFFSIARARRGHLRSTQEERWLRPSSRFVFKTAPIYLLSSVFSSSSSTGYVSLLSMGVEKEPLHQRQPSSLPPSFPPPPPPPLATSLGVRWEKEEGSPKVDCCASFLIVAFR